MSKLKDYAFPTDNINQSGLTKREYFAALALQGILASGKLMVTSGNDLQWASKSATLAADNLIQSLNEDNNE